jgi:hypothetical protein
MDTLIIHTDPEKINAIVEFLKAFDIKFEVQKKGKKSQKNLDDYDALFVQELKKSMADKKMGLGKKTSIEQLETLWK